MKRIRFVMEANLHEEEIEEMIEKSGTIQAFAEEYFVSYTEEPERDVVVNIEILEEK